MAICGGDRQTRSFGSGGSQFAAWALSCFQATCSTSVDTVGLRLSRRWCMLRGQPLVCGHAQQRGVTALGSTEATVMGDRMVGREKLSGGLRLGGDEAGRKLRS